MDSPTVGVGWVEMQRAVIRVLGIQVGNPRGIAVVSMIRPRLGAGCLLPAPHPYTHTFTRLLSFLFTELFFLILISGGFKAKITMKGKSAS